MTAPTRRVIRRARPVGLGLAEVVEQRAEAHAQLGAERRRSPGRRRRGAPRAAPAAASSRGRSRSPARTPAGPRRGRRCRARCRSASPGRAPSRSFDSSPIPSAASAAADPLAPRRAGGPRASARICASVSSGEREAELRDEPQPAEDAQRVLAEALRPDRVQLAALEVREAAERVDELARLEPPRHRVDREVAPRHVVRRSTRSGRRRSRSRDAPARRSAPLRGGVSSMPGRHERPDRRVARVEAHADELAVHLHVLDPPVRLERARAGRHGRRPGTRKSSSACSIPSSSSRTAPPTTYASRPSERT